MTHSVRLIIMICACLLPLGNATPAKGFTPLSLVYSNDVRGELEPCG